MRLPSFPVLPQQPDDWLLSLFTAGGDGSIWLPGSLFVGTFVTEDLSCVAGGIFAAQGETGFVAAVVACTLGIWLGDIGLYVIGFLTARGLLRWGWAQRRMAGLADSPWRRSFERHSTKILFASRFLPGTRVPTYLAAGAIGFSLTRFAAVLGAAVVIWTPLLVGAAAIWGRAVLGALAQWGAYAWFAVPLALLSAWLVVRTISLLLSWHGRRLLYGRWLRLTRWEYWPPLFVFPPVVLDLIRQAIVHRTPAVFTACNRGIPYGGLFGESKGEILDLLGGECEPRARADAEAPGVRVAAWRRLPLTTPLEERLAVVRRFLACDGRCVLKPDQGERGAGVVVVAGEAEARRWLAACPYDAMVQQFVAGEEFGVAWSRDPRTGRGEIHSIAHKVLPTVVGDGARELGELILADERAVAMARFHLRQQAWRATWVPAAGEVVSLGDLGTHARGATFYDARALGSEPLRLAFERLLQDVPGIDFGRFDVRAPSAAALQQGRGIQVLEFNGVTGEAAHVYQPGYPWRHGVRDMIAHLRRAAAIGAHNRRAGHRPATVRQLLSVLVTTLRRPRFEAEPRRPEPHEPSPVVDTLARNVRGA